jgi:quinol monooxygenase YgiN
MISVLVTYQVKQAFTELNKANIQQFLRDFEQLDASKFNYSVSVKEDGVSFVHFSQYADENIQQELLNVPSFKAFQEMRDASGLNDSHQVEILQLVGSKGNYQL